MHDYAPTGMKLRSYSLRPLKRKIAAKITTWSLHVFHYVNQYNVIILMHEKKGTRILIDFLQQKQSSPGRDPMICWSPRFGKSLHKPGLLV